MFIATSRNINEIDTYAERTLGISTRTLMGRAGEAVAEAVRALTPCGRVLILAGKGNNGGDGYAAALSLRPSHEVAVYDVFDGSKRSEAGQYYLSECERENIPVLRGAPSAELLKRADIIVDAIFGTGYSGELTDSLRALAHSINESPARVVAVDLPLGVDGDLGECDVSSVRADITVALCLPKPAHLSYPARELMGELVIASLGLSRSDLLAATKLTYTSLDDKSALSFLPKRENTANKGSFGKVLHVTGSPKYRGAAHLALEASLRSGVGITAHLDFSSAISKSASSLCQGNTLTEELRLKFPEAIYENISADKDPLEHICALSQKYTATLVGSGSDKSYELYTLVKALLSTKGGALILDADAINSIAEYGDLSDLGSARRAVVLTPHPKEFSRLSGLSVEYINSHRLRCAENFAKEQRVTLLLKGAGTVITDGDVTYINSSGSTALAKGGSGDVLAGLTVSLSAQISSPITAAALAAYLHGKAADKLSESLSDFGVTPSDLPRELAKQIKSLSSLE